MALYNEVPDLAAPLVSKDTQPSPWLMRVALDPKKVVARTLDMNQISRKLSDTFGE